MARMIPPIPYADTNSAGELSVFERFRDEPGTDGWIVLHSVNLANHRKAISGEADFVVIVPGEGIVVIEVKGCHTLKLREGVWYYGQDPGGDNRGPFRQASQATWSLREYILKHRGDLAAILFTSAVVMPFCDLPVTSPEWHGWQLIDHRAYRSKTLGQHVRAVLSSARAHALAKGAIWATTGASQPSIDQAGSIATILRPRFEFFESTSSVEKRVESELLAFTKQQYRILDALSANPRVLVEGPAGSGKTVLALESTRRFASTAPGSLPRRVLVACYNAPLASWLRAQLAHLSPTVSVDTLHRHMLRVAHAGARPADAPPEFWLRDLPARAIARQKSQDRTQPLFDVMVLDEAQDCVEPAYLDFLDSMIAGGLEGGTWHAFGDFERQALYEHTPGSVQLGLEYLRTLTVSVRLRSNCRNPPRIAALVRLLAGLDPDYSDVLRPDDGREATWLFYRSANEGRKLLVDQLTTLLSDGLRERDIVILSPRRDDECLAAGVTLPGRKMLSLRSPDQGGIRFGSIHAFKGLEARAVVLTDVTTVLGPKAQDLFYVGVTRAQTRLTILAAESVRADMAKVLSGSISRSMR